MDVTAAKQAEEALRRSESYLADAQRLIRTAVGHGTCPLNRVSTGSKENYRCLASIRKGEYRQTKRFTSAFIQRIETGYAEKCFLKGRTKAPTLTWIPNRSSSGAIKYVRSTGHPVRNISGDVLEYVGTIDRRDRTQAADEEREEIAPGTG